MKRHDKAPNGHFAEGLILYGNLETGAMASQGFLLDRRTASLVLPKRNDSYGALHL